MSDDNTEVELGSVSLLDMADPDSPEEGNDSDNFRMDSASAIDSPVEYLRPWSFSDEIKAPGSSAVLAEQGPLLWLSPDFSEILRPGLLPEDAQCYVFALRLTRPTFAAKSEAALYERLGSEIKADGVRHHVVAIENLHIGPERQTIAQLYTVTETALFFTPVGDCVTLLRWPSPGMANMQAAHPPRRSTTHRDGRVVHVTARPFLPDPPVIGILTYLRDTALAPHVFPESPPED